MPESIPPMSKDPDCIVQVISVPRASRQDGRSALREVEAASTCCQVGKMVLIRANKVHRTCRVFDD
jgi:hypothetical protein